MKIAIINDSFKHNGFIVPGKKPKNIEWKWVDIRSLVTGEDTVDDCEYLCVTDDYIAGFPAVFNFHDKVIALITESEAIIPHAYASIYSCTHLHRFKHIFTHSNYLLNNFANSKWIPGNGVWIGGDYGKGEYKIYPKTKFCSFLSSDKLMCKMHYVRASLGNYLSQYHKDVDIFGTLTNKWVPVIDTLADYKYSIILENEINEHFYTEKLLNCFATGTIPIYFGAKDTAPFWDFGIIRVDNVKELLQQVSVLNKYDSYSLRIEAIEENLKLVQQFDNVEDYIYNSYLKGN